MIIPKGDPILEKLNNEVIGTSLRPYLGLSGIGNTCHRKLQYDHYWAYKKDIHARLHRLFQVGHDAEAIMIADLAKCGIEVIGEQSSIVATAGHWRGHIDGMGIRGEEKFLIEFKTHNHASYNDLMKKGVQKSKSMHYDQCTAYMGYMGLDKALYMALNKNNSEYYIEWVPFDEDHFKELQRKEFEVLSAEELLPKIGSGNKTWFECKFCDARNVCHNKADIEVTCRSCKYVDVEANGKWSCSFHDAELEVPAQRRACKEYILGDMFK